MKPKLLLVMLLFSSMCFAQAPTDYYANYPFTNGLLVNQANPGTGNIANGSYTFVTDRFGNPHSAMDCNNTKAQAIFNNGPQNEFAVSFWVKMDVLQPSSTTGDQRVIDFFENIVSGDYVSFKRTSPTDFEIEYQINTQHASSTFTSNDLESGQWCHIVLQSVKTVNGGTTDNQLQFFLNGNFQNATSANLNLVNSGNAFQAGANLSISRVINFPGLVDDIQLFNRTLTNQEINDVSNSVPCTSVVTIPDANFKAELLAMPSLNFNGNNEIDCFEASSFGGAIDVRNKNIADLTGIEAFTKLRILNCSGNPITSINLSANSSLVNITCNNMPSLTSLNVANGINGVNITVGTTTIGNVLDATASPNLSCIQHDVGFNPDNNNLWNKDNTANWSTNCSATSCASTVNIPDTNFKNALLAHGTTITGTGISVIDTDGDGQICTTEAQAYTGVINVSNRGITDLTGIEAFINLRLLNVEDNQLTTLVVSSITSLQEIYCSGNQIVSLDISQNTSLFRLFCQGNVLTSLNVANGNNSNFGSMNATFNTNLSCIQHDAGFNPNTNNFWNKDNTANWSTNCSATSCVSTVNIPDTNFKNALLAHGTTMTGTGVSVIDTDGDGEICTTEATAYTGTIIVSHKNISDLTGIEAFTNLTKLYCHNNQLTSLNLSANTALTDLVCNNNQLAGLNLSANMVLINLECKNNQLTSLNLPASTALTRLDCGRNQLTGLDVSANTDLTNLGCYYNQLTGLNVSANTALTDLYCHNNQLTGLNISANRALEYLQCNNNQLTSLNVSANTALRDLTCNDNQLTSLNVSASTALEYLGCHNNQLTSLNVANSNNSSLYSIWAEGNPNLTCIQHDSGFNPLIVTSWRKDPTANWSEYDCQDVTFWSKATTGVTNDWATASNWTNGIPNSSLIWVFIPTGSTVYPTVSTDASIDMINNLTIENGATLTIAPSGKLFVDSFTNNGTFEINSNATNSGTFEAGYMSGNVTYNRYVTDKWHLIGAPVSGQDIASFVSASSLATGTANTNHKGLGVYDNTQTAPWVYYQSSMQTANFIDANGYALKRTASGTVAFTGTVNVGNVTYNGIGTATNKFELISNPYTRYLDLNVFLSVNNSNMSATNQALYFWNDAQSRYDVYNSSSTGSKYIAPGQGFFAEMANTNGSFAFLTNMTTHNATRALLRTAPQTEVLISISEGKSQKTTQIKYLANTGKGLDVGYDAGFFDGNQSNLGIYTKLADGTYNDTNFMLQCVGKDSAEETIIPLGIKTDAEKSVTFTAEAMNLPDNLKVFLEDTQTGSVTELSNGGSYEATVNAGSGRFFLHTKESARLSTNNVTLEGINIFKQGNSLQVKGVQEASTVVLHNLQGKKVLTANVNATQSTVSLPKLATGMYIVTVSNNKGNTSKKVIF